jgi:hypothetical protein
MSMFIQSHEGHGLPTGYKDALVVGAMLGLILSLIGCSSTRKEYVVDYTRGDDVTAQGTREHPCQTVVRCQVLADRDGVRSYWMVYQ